MFSALRWMQLILDSQHVLFTANYTKLYRHSYYADYFVYDVAKKTTTPLVADQAGGEFPHLFPLHSS